MKEKTEHPLIERRSEPRAVSKVLVHVIAMDMQGRTIGMLPDVHLLNISSGGMAFISQMPVGPATHISVVGVGYRQPSGVTPQVRFEVLECVLLPNRQYRTRCRLAAESIPTWLIAAVQAEQPEGAA